MAAKGFSEVALGDVLFRVDHREYAPLTWPRRHSVHPVIGGGVTIQDFGVHPKDVKLVLTSGYQQPMATSTVARLHELFRARNSQYTFSDWLDNEFTVFFARFDPRPLEPDKFTCEIELQVTAVHKLLVSLWNEPEEKGS